MLIHMGYLSLWSHLKDLCEVRSGEIFKNWACGVCSCHVWRGACIGFHDHDLWVSMTFQSDKGHRSLKKCNKCVMTFSQRMQVEDQLK